jgi:hypothetical protein
MFFREWKTFQDKNVGKLLNREMRFDIILGGARGMCICYYAVEYF